MAYNKEKSRERYINLKAMGRCPQCGSPIEDDDFICCEKCRERVRENYAYKAAKMTDEQREANNEKSRVRQNRARQERRAQGRCARCGAPSPDKYLCNLCLVKHKAVQANYIAKKKAEKQQSVHGSS